MTDEAWALAERRAVERPVTRIVYFTVATTLFICWQAATLAGTVFGSLIRNRETFGLAFAFPAVFIALALGFWKGARRSGPVMAAGVALVALLRLQFG